MEWAALHDRSISIWFCADIVPFLNLDPTQKNLYSQLTPDSLLQALVRLYLQSTSAERSTSCAVFCCALSHRLSQSSLFKAVLHSIHSETLICGPSTAANFCHRKNTCIVGFILDRIQSSSCSFTNNPDAVHTMATAILASLSTPRETHVSYIYYETYTQ